MGCGAAPGGTGIDASARLAAGLGAIAALGRTRGAWKMGMVGSDSAGAFSGIASSVLVVGAAGTIGPESSVNSRNRTGDPPSPSPCVPALHLPVREEPGWAEREPSRPSPDPDWLPSWSPRVKSALASPSFPWGSLDRAVSPPVAFRAWIPVTWEDRKRPATRAHRRGTRDFAVRPVREIVVPHRNAVDLLQALLSRNRSFAGDRRHDLGGGLGVSIRLERRRIRCACHLLIGKSLDEYLLGGNCFRRWLRSDHFGHQLLQTDDQFFLLRRSGAHPLVRLKRDHTPINRSSSPFSASDARTTATFVTTSRDTPLGRWQTPIMSRSTLRRIPGGTAHHTQGLSGSRARFPQEVRA